MAIDHSDERDTAAEAAPATGEQLRRVAEEQRDVAEAHRRAEETLRNVGERQRESAETARTTAERERAAAEGLRNDAMVRLGTTAKSLQVTLRHMEAVEELRRKLRDAPHPIVRDPS